MKPVIKKICLSKLNINDTFFDSLRESYFEFNKWFKNKQENEFEAYVTFNDKKITSLLIIKVEDKDEDYSSFTKNFYPKKRLKIATLKVIDTNKKIGTRFLEIVDNFAHINGIDEIYITLFENQIALINFLTKNNYKYFCNKDTKNNKGIIMQESVYIKKLK